MTVIVAREPKVSVILPVYNADAYLAQALDSILAQTFDDFEIIAIDDGSTDGSLEILRRYALKDRRVCVASRENRGLVATLNEGIERAQGEYIARMDADDIALPDRFQQQLGSLETRGVDVVGCAVKTFGRHSRVWRYPKTHAGCESQLLFDVCFAHPAVFGRRWVFKTCRYDDAYRSGGQDYDLWQRMWAVGARMGNVSTVGLLYRTHAEQISARKTKQQLVLAQTVRARHWAALLPSQETDWRHVLVAFENPAAVDLAAMTRALQSAIERSEGEGREIVYRQTFRMLCRVAAFRKNAWRVWWRMAGGVRGMDAIGKSAILFGLARLRQAPGGRLYEMGKRLFLR